MTRLFLIRHAEAEGNLYRRVQGHYDGILAGDGYRQIAQLAERFRDTPIDAVYSSDLLRAKATARAFGDCARRLRLDARLRELSLGVWEGRAWGEVARSEREEMRRFLSDSKDFFVHGGETFGELRERMVSAITDIVAAHPGETVAVISHGIGIRHYLASVHKLPPSQVRKVPYSGNTSVSEILFEEAGPRIVLENDLSHLGEARKEQKRWSMGKPKEVADSMCWFRPADFNCVADIEFYTQARDEAWMTIYGSFTNYPGKGFLEEALEHAREDPLLVQFAMIGDEPAGIVQVNMNYAKTQNALHVVFFYLSPKFRHAGLGAQLMGEVVFYSRLMGREGVQLCCAQQNMPAQRFYQKHGFRKIGQEETREDPLDVLYKPITYEQALAQGLALG